jgi:hypothetical protein
MLRKGSTSGKRMRTFTICFFSSFFGILIYSYLIPSTSMLESVYKDATVKYVQELPYECTDEGDGSSSEFFKYNVTYAFEDNNNEEITFVITYRTEEHPDNVTVKYNQKQLSDYYYYKAGENVDWTKINRT